MRLHNKYIRFSVLVSVLLIPCELPAQEDQCFIPTVSNADDAKFELNELRRRGCLGEMPCKTPLCQEVNQFVDRWKGKEITPQTFAEAGTIYQAIRESASRLPAQRMEVMSLRAMLREWSPLLATTTGTTVSDLESRRTIEWLTKITGMFSGTKYEVNLNQEIDRCGASEDACTQALESAASVFTHSLLVDRLLDTLLSGPNKAFNDHLEKLDQQWQAYLGESRAFYPWELLLNGWFFEPRQTGFSEPPNRQILLLHPSAALSYNDSADDKLEEALVLDVIGFYRWSWGSDNESAIVNPFGLALAVSWDGDHTGYGVSAHFSNNYSLSVTADEDDVFLLFNVDLGNFILDKRKLISDFRETLVQY